MNNNVFESNDINNEKKSFDGSKNNVLTPEMNNNKSFTKVLLAILVIALIVVISLGGWRLGIKYANLENNNEKVENSNNVDNNYAPEEDDVVIAKNDKYTFYKENSIVVDLNGKKVNVLTYYYVDKESLLIEEDDKTMLSYVIRRDVFVETNKILDGVIAAVVSDEQEVDNVVNDFNITSEMYDTFSDTNKSDKYLVLYLSNSDKLIYDNSLITRYSPAFTNAYIINDKSELLKTISYSNDTWKLVGIFVDKNDIGDRNFVKSDVVITEDEIEPYTDYMIYTESVIDYHDTYIYYVDGDCEIFKEYKLSITDGKLKEELLRTYKGDSVRAAGGC